MNKQLATLDPWENIRWACAIKLHLDQEYIRQEFTTVYLYIEHHMYLRA